MKFKSILVASGAFAMMMPTQAFAAPISSEEAVALLKRLDQLEQEVISLRKKLGDVETAQQKQSEKVAAAPKVKQKKSDNNIKWKGAPEIRSSNRAGACNMILRICQHRRA